MKYDLELLHDPSLIGSKPATIPMDPNVQLNDTDFQLSSFFPSFL